ncbi:hypothetical protein AVEN_63718-1 [Araneus ventricosus]|uniref:Uncharacterized protein n=1 Tax=Araneus ventricosus TaxID=182803 RepID=A0A4Y1ZKK6_ARAVE|nr:hypothetical protein AVEN_265877-1 [Araneus ventricosus]GBL54200.1 hypothetical protein AVEN_63718-1 [Araneus ventricosus]
MGKFNFFSNVLLQTWKVASQQCESYGLEESFTGISRIFLEGPSDSDEPSSTAIPTEPETPRKLTRPSRHSSSEQGVRGGSPCQGILIPRNVFDYRAVSLCVGGAPRFLLSSGGYLEGGRWLDGQSNPGGKGRVGVGASRSGTLLGTEMEVMGNVVILAVIH